MNCKTLLATALTAASLFSANLTAAAAPAPRTFSFTVLEIPDV